jgi:hypothetical protein
MQSPWRSPHHDPSPPARTGRVHGPGHRGRRVRDWRHAPPGRPAGVTLDYLDLFILALAVALGDQLLLPRKVGRSTALSVAVIASLALLLQSPALVLLLSVAAWSMQALRSLRSKRPIRLGHLPLGALLAWSLAGTTLVVGMIDPLAWTIGRPPCRLRPGDLAIWVFLLLVAPAIESLEVTPAGARRAVACGTRTWCAPACCPTPWWPPRPPWAPLPTPNSAPRGAADGAAAAGRQARLRTGQRHPAQLRPDPACHVAAARTARCR